MKKASFEAQMARNVDLGSPCIPERPLWHDQLSAVSFTRNGREGLTSCIDLKIGGIEYRIDGIVANAVIPVQCFRRIRVAVQRITPKVELDEFVDQGVYLIAPVNDVDIPCELVVMQSGAMVL